MIVLTVIWLFERDWSSERHQVDILCVFSISWWVLELVYSFQVSIDRVRNWRSKFGWIGPQSSLDLQHLCEHRIRILKFFDMNQKLQRSKNTLRLDWIRWTHEFCSLAERDHLTKQYKN